MDKTEELKEARRLLGLTQEQMAGLLDIGPSYLSQLENGHRPVQPWLLKRVHAEVESFRARQKIELLYSPFETELRRKCHGHLDALLDACAHDQHRLSWLYVELSRLFPMNSSLIADLVSSKTVSDAESRAIAAAERLAASEPAAPPPTPPTPAPSAGKSAPSGGASPKSKARPPVPPAPAQE